MSINSEASTEKFPKDSASILQIHFDGKGQCNEPKCNQKQTSQNHFEVQYITVSDLVINIKLDSFTVGDQLNEGSFNIRSYCDSCVNGVQLPRPLCSPNSDC